MPLKNSKKIYSSSFNVFDEGAGSYSYDGMVIDNDQVVEDEICLENLRITGNARFMEIADADTIDIIGNAEFKTFATCDDLNISGSAVFKDDVIAESIVISGGASIMGKVSTDVLIIDGKVRTNSDISALSVSISGYLNCLHKLSFDKCHVSGTLIAVGVVKGIDIKFKSSESSSVKRIIADEITVSGKPAKGTYILSCDEADCEKAIIEYAKIDHLMCDDCIIGRGCRIGTLECRGTAQISNDSYVEKMKRL